SFIFASAIFLTRLTKSPCVAWVTFLSTGSISGVTCIVITATGHSTVICAPDSVPSRFDF
ncbi:hypothetical protein RRG08_064108, partial [Elysia crispata]